MFLWSFFLKMYKVWRIFFLYEVFILRLWRLGHLSCVLFITVFIKAVGTRLVLNCALSFVKQCSDLYTWLTKQHTKIALQSVKKRLISCWYAVLCVGTILDFQSSFVIFYALSYIHGLVQRVLSAWLEHCVHFLTVLLNRGTEKILAPQRLMAGARVLAGECSTQFWKLLFPGWMFSCTPFV